MTWAGATGGVLVGLTGKVPGLRGILMELPFSGASAETAIKESGGADRVSFFSGNFFEGPTRRTSTSSSCRTSFTTGTMGNALHSWDTATTRYPPASPCPEHSP